jgi:hypothetical protein
MSEEDLIKQKASVIKEIFNLKQDISESRRLYLFDYLFDQPLNVLISSLKELKKKYDTH